MFKSLAFGLGTGFLGLAGAAATPVIVGILGAFGGASAIVGFGAWRAFRKMQRARESDCLSASPLGGTQVIGTQSKGS